MRLVSCVMPTWNRRPFVRAAIQCFLEQTYENRELVIVDDGDDRILDLVPDDQRIRYVPSNRRLVTGAKRNLCNELAQGEIICHFDDDDWSAPTRLQDQVDRLEATALPITGYGTLLFWDVLTRQVKRYRANAANMKNYVCGTSFCYLRSFWEQSPFPDRQVASDNAFIYSRLNDVAASQDCGQLVARIHDHHTSEKGGITEVVPRELVPAGFWLNEQVRLACSRS